VLVLLLKIVFAQVKKEAAAAARRSAFSVPPHWSETSLDLSARTLSLVHVKREGAGSEVRAALQQCLEGNAIGHGGRDQHLSGRYTRLVLQEAWRVENVGLLQTYQGARQRVMALDGRVRASRKEKIRAHLYHASEKLPWDLEKSCNEVNPVLLPKPGDKSTLAVLKPRSPPAR
jgi:hypothetical protein